MSNTLRRNEAQKFTLSPFLYYWNLMFRDLRIRTPEKLKCACLDVSFKSFNQVPTTRRHVRTVTWDNASNPC